MWRRLAGVAAIAVAVTLGLRLAAYRAVEAEVAGWLSGLLLGTGTFVSSGRAEFFLNVGTAEVFGLRITPECTSGIVTALIVGVSGVLLASSRIGSRRLGAAAAVGSATFAVINMARLVMVAAASLTWGLDTGYRWSHTWVGSIVTVFGVVVACAVYLRVLGVGARSRPQTLRP